MNILQMQENLDILEEQYDNEINYRKAKQIEIRISELKREMEEAQ